MLQRTYANNYALSKFVTFGFHHYAKFLNLFCSFHGFFNHICIVFVSRVIGFTSFSFLFRIMIRIF